MRYVRVSAWILTILGAAGVAQAADPDVHERRCADSL